MDGDVVPVLKRGRFCRPATAALGRDCADECAMWPSNEPPDCGGAGVASQTKLLERRKIGKNKNRDARLECLSC